MISIRLGIAALLTLPLLTMPLSAQPVEEQFATVDAAYDWLLESPSYPPAFAPKDQGAVQRIRENPLELLPRLRGDLVKSASSKPTFFKSYGTFLDLGDPKLQLNLARDVVRTYALTDESPFSSYLAAWGEPQDMERIAAEMRADPDGLAVGLALVIIQNNNPAGLAMLEELKPQLPGVWQRAIEAIEIAPLPNPEIVPEATDPEPSVVHE